MELMSVSCSSQNLLVLINPQFSYSPIQLLLFTPTKDLSLFTNEDKFLGLTYTMSFIFDFPCVFAFLSTESFAHVLLYAMNTTL